MAESRRDDLPNRIKNGLDAFAHHLLIQQGTRTSLEDKGIAIAQREGRAAPYDADTIHAWITGQDVPSYSTICAIGALYIAPNSKNRETELAYLMYGSDLLTYGVNEGDWQRYTDTVPLPPQPAKPRIGFRP